MLKFFRPVGWLVLLLSGWVQGQEANGQSKSDDRIEQVESDHLANLFQLNGQLYSGGLPDGEAAFAELQKLGVKTIISVDGAAPDVATAKKFGLRYVHLPHGYDGISPERSLELAKAVRDLPGPIYIHCHHGKHRSPAAAATACRILGQLDAVQAQAFLQEAGTSPNYRGLYQAVESARPCAEAELDRLRVEFPETAPLTPIVESMVEMEHIFDRLKANLNHQVTPPKDGHTDTFVELEHEALLLREQFTELMRHAQTQEAPKAYQDLLRDAEDLARQLEQALNRESKPFSSPEHLQMLMGSLSQNCADCHRQFRDQSKSSSRLLR